jgi:hypothetical protein
LSLQAPFHIRPDGCNQRSRDAQLSRSPGSGIGREEAKANAPRVAEHFDEIDADRDGKVTMAELHAHHQKMREQHRAEHGDQSGEKKQ